MKYNAAGMRTLALQVIGTIAIGTALACAHNNSSPRTRVRLAGSQQDDTTKSLTVKAIASMYSQRLANISAETINAGGTAEIVQMVETGDAECGLGSADLVSSALLVGTSRLARPHARLRGVAVLSPNVVHLVTRENSRLLTLADLSGKRIGAAVPNPGTGGSTRRETIASVIAALAPRHVPPTTLLIRREDAMGQLERGEIDAVEFWGGYPFPLVTQAAMQNGIRFIEFDEAAISLAKPKNPFLKPAVIPVGTYPGQRHEVRTVAVDNVLVCRDELPASIVYDLTRALYEGASSVNTVQTALQQINPEEGGVTPIPLHDGAMRYYRERKLFR